MGIRDGTLEIVVNTHNTVILDMGANLYAKQKETGRIL